MPERAPGKRHSVEVQSMLESFERVMITGGAGFIGSHLCEGVMACGKQVTAIDDLSTGKEANVPPGVGLVRVDISQRNSLRDVMRGIDVVFHLAAQPSVGNSIEEPDRDFRSNTLGTYNVLMAAREAGVKKLVYTSSSAVYGEPKRLPLHESDLPCPGNPYGASKLCGEHYCQAFAAVYGLAYTCLRPFNVYGPRENLESSGDEVAHYVVAIMQGQPITVHGDGSQTRDFIHVRDVVRSHILAADNDRATGKVFNIGTGQETSINDLVKMIEEAARKKATIRREPWSKGDIHREFGDISLARKEVGFAPETELIDGIRGLVRDFETSSR